MMAKFNHPAEVQQYACLVVNNKSRIYSRCSVSVNLFMNNLHQHVRSIVKCYIRRLKQRSLFCELSSYYVIYQNLYSDETHK